MYTFKGEHKFTDNVVAERAVYLQQDRRARHHDHEGRQAVHGRPGPWFGPLRRRPHVLVFNNTNVINNTTVLTLRYGWTTWQDSCDSAAVFGGHSVARLQPGVRERARPGGTNIFPSLSSTRHRGRRRLGPGPVRWKGPMPSTVR